MMKRLSVTTPSGRRCRRWIPAPGPNSSRNAKNPAPPGDLLEEPGGAFERNALAEPMTGIEPAPSAWEAEVLPLNYIGSAPTDRAGVT